MNLLRIALKNIRAKSWSSLLSVILIAFGVGLLCILILFRKQMMEQFEKNQAGIDLVVGAKGSPLQLILNAMFHVDAPTGNVLLSDTKFLFNPKNPYIEKAVPLSIGDSYKTFRIVGTNESYLELYPAQLAQGSTFDRPMEVNVGYAVAEETGLKIGDTFFSSHGFNEGDLEHDDADPFIVTGIFEPHGSVIDKLILTRFESIWQVHEGHDHKGHNHEEDDHAHHDHNEHDQPDKDTIKQEYSLVNPIGPYVGKSITSVLVRFQADKKRAIPVINMPRNINENTPVMATSPTYQLNKLIANLATVIKSLSYLAYLIAGLSALSIFISLYNNLKERKHELAMMRVGGASPSQLSWLIIWEALIIGFVGALLGIVLAHFALAIISGLLNNQFHYSLEYLNLDLVEFYLVIATLIISVVAALIPAVKAYKTDVIQSLTR